MDTATKQDLIQLENRIDTRIVDLENRIDSRMTDLESRLKADMTDLENRLLEQMRNIETSLLTEFRKWAVPVNARLRTGEITDASLTERVGLLEERVNELDRRNPSH